MVVGLRLAHLIRPLESGMQLQCILHGHGKVMSVDFSRSGDYVAVADKKGKVTVWNYTGLPE